MPVARGLMQMDRSNSYNTTTGVNIVESGPYSCGETIHFHVVVTNITSGTPVPTGTVNIFDFISSSVIATGTLSGGTVNIPYTLTTNTINIQAQYLGTITNPVFAPSHSSPNILITGSSVSTTTTVTSPAPSSLFCADQNLSVTAHVASGSGVPTGNVQFYWWSDNSHSFLFDTQPLSGGNATGTLPANTIAGSFSGTQIWLQAFYLGNGCFGPSMSPNGTSGTTVFAVNNQTVTITFTDPPSGTVINTGDGLVVSLDITSSLVVNEGSVTLWSAFSDEHTPPSDFPSGDWSVVPTGVHGVNFNPGAVVSGTAAFLFNSDMSGSFFNSLGTYYFVAAYGFSTCFGANTSDPTGAGAYNIVATSA
jgi:hypothetical protein